MIKSTSDFPKDDIDAMRETLAEAEWEGLKDRDLKAILREGCVGWENIPDKEVIEMYENIYGETDNVELVICDKNINKGQGEVTAKFNDIQ
jgi:hypothetical protein